MASHQVPKSLLFSLLFPFFRKEEDKWLYFDFESLGSGACLEVDYGDDVVHAYGDESYCSEWRPNVQYVPGIDMINPVELAHPYNFYGVMNVTATASNIVTSVDITDYLTVIVTDAPCRYYF